MAVHLALPFREMPDDPVDFGLRPPLVAGNPSLHDISEEVARPLDARPTLGWFACFAVAVTALLAGAAAVTYEIATGIGTWGLNRTVGWAFDITNFVFWVGIGHAGTLISAILLLFRQKWRTSIARSAEAMTIFAVMCAGLFPAIHMGRPWFAFWVMPYPNSRGPLWVNFRSPLLWDVFAISTYFTISLVFWYVGMIPDLAILRDRAKGRIKRTLYGLFSLGWNGSHRTWSRYEMLSLLLAGLAAPLVVSVHSIVSMDFATSVIPGWHTTLFPPYFVAGAVFSGFGMVMTLLLLTRKVMNLERYITLLHLEAMAKILLLTGTMVGFCYLTEFFVAWYSGNPFERYAFVNRATGPYAWAYWTMMSCNLFVPQLLWSKRLRTSLPVLFVVSLLVNVGMWFERFVIIVTSLHRDFLPSSWSMYRPTIIEVATLTGSFGLFFTLFLLFIRFLPVIAMWEIKGVVGGAQSISEHEEGAHA
ncbi:MAG TPA: NrfD/PsrC family molybdoenzyme membrane anchor subunit [Thermoanaerobaculia bacterium]|nr:NrfD/PsrC family molybdoenzyme membrane anchor subunit [Thermoanaerobaculia bacterium]